MIPIADSVRSRSVPYVNIAFILVNIVMFMYEVHLSSDAIARNVTELDRFIFRWGNIPACTFDAAGVGGGLSAADEARCGLQPNALLTPLTAMFLHGSWLHVLGNMLFLWIFGDNVEDALGHARYLLFYVVGGLLAAFAHGAVNASAMTPAIGASGAIAAVMAAYLVLYPRATVSVILGFIIVPIPLPAFVLIGFWFVSQLFMGFSSLGVDAVGGSGGVAYFAHIGGFIAGALLVRAFMLGRRPARPARPARGW